MSDLTAEQLAIIEDNKRKALEKRFLRKAQEAKCIVEDFSQDNVQQYSHTGQHLCQSILQDGRQCLSVNVDKELLGSFEIKVCVACKKRYPEFDLITKNECTSIYLLPQDTINCMKFCTRNNPRQAGWKPMKLYLRKEAEKLSIERFGSLENLENLKKVRAEQKFERGLVKSQSVISSSAERYRWELECHMDPTLDSGTGDSLVSKKRKAAATNDKKSISSDITFFKRLAKSLMEDDKK